MDDHFDICRVFEISKFDIARLTCIRMAMVWHSASSFRILKEIYHLCQLAKCDEISWKDSSGRVQ